MFLKIAFALATKPVIAEEPAVAPLVLDKITTTGVGTTLVLEEKKRKPKKKRKKSTKKPPDAPKRFKRYVWYFV